VTAPHLLHVFSTFNLGGPQTRAVQLLNAWGGKYRHSIVSVGSGEFSAADRLANTVAAEFPEFPDLKSGSLLGRLWRIQKRTRELKADLALTYNWGAIEVVMSMRVFRTVPVVHHEDGFGPDEATTQLPRRILFRRLALPGTERLIVPSRTLERAAIEIWRRPPDTVSCVPNGVDLNLYEAPPGRSAVPGLGDANGALVVGTVAGLRPEKNLTRLVRVFARASEGLNARLVIVGVGPEEERIREEARRLGVAARVVLPGFLSDPHTYVDRFDLFALTSDTEQFPISLLEAMAARCPAVCTRVGDISEMVSRENLPWLAERNDEDALTKAMRTLLNNENLRRKVGAANRTRAEANFSLTDMIATYDRIYQSALYR